LLAVALLLDEPEELLFLAPFLLFLGFFVAFLATSPVGLTSSNASANSATDWALTKIHMSKMLLADEIITKKFNHYNIKRFTNFFRR